MAARDRLEVRIVHRCQWEIVLVHRHLEAAVGCPLEETLGYRHLLGIPVIPTPDYLADRKRIEDQHIEREFLFSVPIDDHLPLFSRIRRTRAEPTAEHVLRQHGDRTYEGRQGLQR